MIWATGKLFFLLKTSKITWHMYTHDITVGINSQGFSCSVG